MHLTVDMIIEGLSYAEVIQQFDLVPCKRRSSVNSGAWLRGFDDVTEVEKGCVAKAKKGKKVKEKRSITATKHTFPQNMECMEVCDA